MGHELEGALGVEGVNKRRRREGAMGVEVIVTHCALVTRAYAHFLAPVALEHGLRVFELELVLWMAKVRDFIVLHGLCKSNGK